MTKIEIGMKAIATEQSPEGKIVTHGIITAVWEPIPGIGAPEMVTVDGIAQTIHHISIGVEIPGKERERTITIPTAQTADTSIEIMQDIP